MQAQQNELLTRVGPNTPCGDVLKKYWQPAALVDEFDERFDPLQKNRPLKAVRLFGQNLVLFRTTSGQWSMLDSDCAHRGADLSFARHEGDGIRCPFHGWKFAANGDCLDTPAEPMGSMLHQRVRQRSYPVIEKSGVIFVWMGPENETPPPLPELDCFNAPSSHSFAFKGLWNANWLQCFEVGIDPAHPSFLHRFLHDEELSGIGNNAAGKQFRSASVGSVNGQSWPMTKIMREFSRPDINFEVKPYGMQILSIRPMTEELTHVRVTQSIFPATFVIPLSESMTITQMHVPVDDENTYWYSFFTSFTTPLDKEAMRQQRLKFISLPNYIPKSGRHNHWGFKPSEQIDQTYLGMGEDDINVHDQWAVESMGSIQDRTREHLGTSDKLIMANRRVLLQAIEDLKSNQPLPGIANADIASQRIGPDTVDGIAPSGTWPEWWPKQVEHKQNQSSWHPNKKTQKV
jgi:phenylpropionate dioxygenase-like ring-hydroxylating dioxygenase large terminal subunit